MMTNENDILELLKFELDFIEKGGYGRSVRTPWKPTSIFQDSPTCLNFGDPARPLPCDECFLMRFVPPERRSESVPCHYIPLNEAGDTVEAISSKEGQQELEEAVKVRLRAAIRQIEEKRAAALRSPKKRILIVDDDKHALIALAALLEIEGFDTTPVWSGQDALEHLRSEHFDLVLLDDCLPDLNSSELLWEVQKMEVQPWVIVMQAKPLTGAITRFTSLGACGLVGKWMPRCEITQVVRTCLTSTALAKADA